MCISGATNSVRVHDAEGKEWLVVDIPAEQQGNDWNRKIEKFVHVYQGFQILIGSK